MGLLTVCGVSLNAIIIYLYCITPKLYTKPMNLLFISLTMADFTVSVCATFTSFVHTLLRSDMSEKLCGWYAFFATFAGKKIVVGSRWINIAHDAGRAGQGTSHSDAKPKHYMIK